MNLPDPRKSPAIVVFFPFRLDRRARRLYRGEEPVPLRPKTFAVLSHLIEHAGAVVSRQALLESVWSDVTVTEDMPRLSVGEIRRALGDDPRAPRFVETVARQGYCFIAPLDAPDARVDAAGPEGAPIVGRDAALAELDAWLEAALAGRRQIGFVTGEVGAGKTTLLDAALARMRRRRFRNPADRLQIATGQCVEQRGVGEPYMPILEALGRLGRKRGEAANRTQMLRTLADALESQAAERPLVLVLEDLHWSDPSTVALLDLLAHRSEPARLLVISTLRTADALATTHPAPGLQQELVRKGLSRELRLQGLRRVDVAGFLNERLPAGPASASLVDFFLTRTEGNPFFLVALCDHLREQGMLVESVEGWRLEDPESAEAITPAGARAAIEARIDGLSAEEVEALEAATIVGMEFSSPIAAAGFRSAEDSGRHVEDFEALCDSLVRREEFLSWSERPRSEANPAGYARHYSFRHALYRQVLYERIPPSRARRLNRAIGEEVEAREGERTATAATLAAHFERSGDFERALHYHHKAADSAREHFADPEVAFHLEAAARVLRRLPDTPQRSLEELETLQKLTTVSLGFTGLSDDKIGTVFSRKLELAERMGRQGAVFVSKTELFFHHQTRAELGAAEKLARELVALGSEMEGEPLGFAAHTAMGSLQYNLGALEPARSHLDRAHELFDPSIPHSAPVDLGVLHLRYRAGLLAMLGWPDRAVLCAQEAVARAESVGRPSDHAFGHVVAAELATLLDDPMTALAHAELALEVCREYDLPLFAAGASLVRGWALTHNGAPGQGIGVARAAMAELDAIGQRIGKPYFCSLLADASLRANDVSGALESIDSGRGRAEATGERRADSELSRLRGEALLRARGSRARHAEAQACLRDALRVSSAQGAKLFELRAALSLARLEAARGSTGTARQTLAAVYESFSEGFECADLVRAWELL